MKREILCLACEQKMKEFDQEVAAEDDFTTPPEETGYVQGFARREYICDLCGTPISKGENCVFRTTTIYPDRLEHERIVQEAKEFLARVSGGDKE